MLPLSNLYSKRPITKASTRKHPLRINTFRNLLKPFKILDAIPAKRILIFVRVIAIHEAVKFAILADRACRAVEELGCDGGDEGVVAC